MSSFAVTSFLKTGIRPFSHQSTSRSGVRKPPAGYGTFAYGDSWALRYGGEAFGGGDGWGSCREVIGMKGRRKLLL